MGWLIFYLVGYLATLVYSYFWSTDRKYWMWADWTVTIVLCLFWPIVLAAMFKHRCDMHKD